MKIFLQLCHKEKRRPYVVVFLLALILAGGISRSVCARTTSIPEELKQWIPWVLYEQEENLCTLTAAGNSQRYCSWPSSLNLDVLENGATFNQTFTIESKTLVFLPGKSPFWPENVKSNDKAVLVIEHKGKPAIWLSPGKYRLSGSFRWQKMPDSLFVPPATGMINLTLFGKKVTDLQVDTSGRLWLRKTGKIVKSQEDALSIQVFRKIIDGVPLTQQLRILFTVSGMPREITLGLKTDDTFIPLSLRSPLPVRLDDQGRLQLQVRPGQWQIQLTLRNTGALSPKTLTRGQIDGPWPDHEIWVFAADPKLRQVEVSGLTPVDPSRTSLPEDWQVFPAYMQEGDTQMVLSEKSRANPNPTPNRLEIRRKLWLDEEGGGLTALDHISGTMGQGWRLNAAPQQLLGKVEVEGNSRLITRIPGSDKTGVEVRQGKLQLTAESRIEQMVKSGQLTIPALGWDHSFQKLSAELNLPPGWQLFTASGIDRVPTWLNHWTLLDIFLVLIISLAAGRILGLGWGALTLLTLILTYHQPGSPRYLWLPLIALVAIQKLITVKSGERILRISIFLILGIIIITAIPYMVNEIRTGLYPQLGYGKYHRIIPRQDQDYQQSQVNGDMTDGVMEQEAASPRRLMAAKSKSGTAVSSYRMLPEPVSPKPIQIDPQAMIQTGPGLPTWQWKKLQMTWNGPVRPEQQIRLVLIPPVLNTVLAFVRVMLLGLMILGFLRGCLNFAKRFNGSSISPALLIFLLSLLTVTSFSGRQAQAEIPPPELLQELQDRLLAPPECGNSCVSLNFCEISVDNDLLQLTLKVDVVNQTAIPLPGKNRFFDTIQLDNKDAGVLRVSKKGNTLIRLQPGSHSIRLSKNLQQLSKVSLSFPMLPKQTRSSLRDWSLIGLRENGALDKQITLTKIVQAPGAIRKENKGDLNSISIVPFVQIQRTVHMGLKWNMETTVIRRSPKSVIALNIPLFPGERVITDHLQIQDNSVKVNMGAGQNRFQWHSSLEPVDTMTLTAAKTDSWTEIWFLDVSPIWHVQAEGIPEINQTNPAGMRYPEYHPYPGESLHLNISRPEGVPGKILTISRSRITVKQGKRAADMTLRFTLTASRGLRHTITLPADIDLQKTMIDLKEVPLQYENNQIIIPVHPGSQEIAVSWRSEGEIPYKLITQSVDLGADSVNHSTEISLPYSRWILLTGGPRIGPAVLFWGELLVIILFALLLGRIRFTPLSTLQWLLLSLGLSQVPVFLAAIVVIWLLLLGLRKERGKKIPQPATFNVVQVLLVFLTLIALGVLFFAIQQGLLGSPDMQISGNGSNNHLLHWYQDRNESLLPTAWVISVPLFAYRISMLLWALWLAMALLKWLRWGWDCFTEAGVWKHTVRKQKKKPVTKPKKNLRKETTTAKKSIPATNSGAVKKTPEKQSAVVEKKTKGTQKE